MVRRGKKEYKTVLLEKEAAEALDKLKDYVSKELGFNVTRSQALIYLVKKLCGEEEKT